MTLVFIFDPSFAGAKTQYMYVTDRGNNVTDWQPVGTFTVGGSVTSGMVTIVNPSTGQQGQTLNNVAITGYYTHFAAGSAVSFGNAGITPSNVQVTDGTHLTATLTISPTAATGTSAVTVTTGSEVATATGLFRVTAVPPTLANVSATTATAGDQITISGSRFGSAQGSGQVWLGSRPGVVVSWSDNTIVAKVASGAKSAVVQVCQNAAWSNSLAFTVLTPNVTSISQAGNQVTITGSNFGATQNNGQVWLGTAYGLVQTWGGGQIVAQVAAGSSSGTVQVLQNGVWSNALPFTMNTLRITSVSPTSGAPGTPVTFTGTGFGSSVSNGMVWLGSAAGNIISWSDTQIVASVAPGAVSGVARVQQNGVWSNAVGFTVPGGGNTLTPAMVNMTVGDTYTIRAVNASGQPVTGLAWSSSNPAVVSLSADDPPVLTALAVGHVTITAGTGSADVTVSATPPPVGTTLWSNPTPWATVSAILPAVPSATGVADVFALNYNSGNNSNLGIAAITSDGATAWTANLSNSCPNCAYPSPPAVPDFQGGLLAVVWNSATRDYAQIVKLDGLTGQTRSIYSSPVGDVGLDAPVPHPDGTAFVHQAFCYNDGTWPNCGDWVVGIDSVTGAQKFSIPIGLEGPSGGRGAVFRPNGLIVAGDGFAYGLYLAYEYFAGAQVFVAHLMILRVATDGTYSNMELKSWTNRNGTRFYSGGLISNGDQGVVVTWDVVDEGSDPSNYTLDTHNLGMALASGSGATVVNDNGPLVSGQKLDPGPATANPVQPVLQAQDGSFVGQVFTDAQAMVSFDATGAIRWVVPNDQPAIATEDGGVIGQSGIIYDQNGGATGQMGLTTPSWTAQAYSLSGGVLADVVQPPPQYASSWGDVAGGNLSRNGTSIAFLTWMEGLPLFARARGPACQLGSTKSALPGPALAQYNTARQGLLSGNYLTSQACASFFNAKGRDVYFGQLTNAVTNQLPFDGLQTTISMYDAGIWTHTDVNKPTFPQEWKKTPICSNFSASNTNIIVAEAQTQPPARDAYFNPRPKVWKKLLTQSTILHEALHSLTGFNDSALAEVLGATLSPGGGTNGINTVLVTNGCAGN